MPSNTWGRYRVAVEVFRRNVGMQEILTWEKMGGKCLVLALSLPVAYPGLATGHQVKSPRALTL